MPAMSAFSKTAFALSLGLTCFPGLVAAQGTPAPRAAQAPSVSAATNRAVSSVAVEISAVVKGKIVSCPKTLKVSASAVCLYVQNAPASLRPLVRGRLGARAAGDWKTAGQSSSLLVSAAAGGPASAFVLLSPLGDRESLVVVDAPQQTATRAAARPATPAGVVKGQPYVLGRDLAGVVNVAALGGGKFRLTRAGGEPLTVTAGQKTAQLGGGSVELPLVPATDGTNLIFPLAGLRALGCTLTPAGAGVTVACGSESVGLRPIVF